MAPFLYDDTSCASSDHMETGVKKTSSDRPGPSNPVTTHSSSTRPAKTAQDPSTLLGLLQRAASLWPDHGIAFKSRGWDEDAEFLSYADLLLEAKTNAVALRAHGIVTSSKPIVLYYDNHRDNLVWYWSTIAAGGVPALLSPLSSNANTLELELQNLEQLFDGPTVITADHLAAVFSETPIKTVWPTRKVVGNLNLFIAEISIIDSAIGREDELATILFTSGSTGPAKGVEYTHSQLIVSSKLKSMFHGMDASNTFMSWVGFDHSAALCENHLHALYSGANQVMVPAIDLVSKPMRFWQVLSDSRISYTFAPNFFIAAATKDYDGLKVEEQERLGLDFTALRVIMCGGEANKTATIDLAEQLLTRYNAPPCSIKASYGLSETCSALFYNIMSPRYDVEREYVFASVGKHLPQHELRIVDEEGRNVEQGQSGSIQVRGALVFQRYFNNPTATDACKTADAWFDTGDLGSLDENDNLRIMGRSKEILIINGQNYSSFELEHAIESTHINGLNKSFTAAISIWVDGAESEDLVILFNPSDDNHQPSPELREVVAQVCETCIRFCRKRPYAVVPLPKRKLPKSSIGKLSRAKLKKAWQAGEFDEYVLPSEPESSAPRGAELSTPLQKLLAQVLAEQTKADPARLHLDFLLADLSLDSLGYLRLKRTLEITLAREESLSLPHLLSCKTIGDLDTMLLSIGATTTDYEPLVPLVSSGSKQPLILCHPAGGDYSVWLNILKYIPDRPAYALRARGFHKDELPFDTLEQMLDIYVAGIQRYFPHGPYALLGLCFGSMLAFELGKRFEEMGETVVFCGGIDCPPEVGRLARGYNRSKDRDFRIDLLHFHQLVTFEQAKQIEHDMRDVPDSEFSQAFYDHFPPGTLENVDLTRSRIRNWSRINTNMQQIARAYEPTGQISTFDCFWVPPCQGIFDVAEDEWFHSWLGVWSRFVSEEAGESAGGHEKALRFHRVNGNHYTVLRPENVVTFQETLKAALVARGI